MHLTSKVAERVVNTEYEDLPPEIVETTKKFILDTLAVAVAGSSATGCRQIVEQVKYWAGMPESTLLVYGGKVPAMHAALANSMMAHARDFDDTHEEVGAHCYASALPAGLCLAEKEAATGKELITSVTVGVDLMCKIGLAFNLAYGWHPTAVLGVLGSVISAGKILKLGKEEMINAIGIAYCQVAGNRQGRRDGALTKRMQPGFASKAGVLAAILAQKGITGAKSVLEGQHGFFTLYREKQGNNSNRASTTLKRKLNQQFEQINISIKPYPCCRSTHASIDSTLNLIQENEIKPREIEEVTVFASKQTFEKVGRPFQIRTNPQVDAQFSIPYTVAVAILRGKVGLSDFEEDAVKDPAVQDMAKKVTVVVDSKLKGRVPTSVRIKLRDGKAFSHTTDIIKGHPQNPMTPEEHMQKIKSCFSYSDKPFSRENVKKLASMVENLEKLQNTSELIKLLEGGK